MFEYRDLKKYIDGKGYRYKFIAEKAGISAPTFSGILNGKRKCSLEEYVSLCMALNVPFNTFINQKSSNFSVRPDAESSA